MKKSLFFLILFSIMCLYKLQAQLNIGGKPMSFSYENTKILEPLTFDQMPPLDMKTIEAEDEQWEAERAAGAIKIGRRFGIEFEVDYDLNNSGIWTTLPDGGKLWRLGIECPGALSINLIFDQYHLPAGATLYVFADDKSDKIGGFTDYNNQADNFFATDIVLSDKIVIEYYQPQNVAFEGELHLSTIVHGYRGSNDFQKSFGQAGACQRNTICPEGESWQDQVRSVFALYSGGSELCSGTILNNTANDGTPYALTANHCWNAAQNTGTWVFRFRWESPTCTPSTNSSYYSITGAVLRAKTPTSLSASDACLVELNQPIPLEWDVYYAGWSRSLDPSPVSMCISHPSLDIKKISPSNPLYLSNTYVLGWHTDWSTNACTEGGSSGSGLFDLNGRLVGQLYGGKSGCSTYGTGDHWDEYGRFDISWNYGTSSSTRLKDWLDPLNLDPETLNGRYGEIVDAELLAIIVPEESYTSAATIEPKVTVKNSGDFTITSAMVSYNIDGTDEITKTWTGTLEVGATVDITFDAIILTYGTHVFEATVTVDDDGNSANNKKSKNYEVTIGNAPYVNYDSYQVAGGDLLTYISTNKDIEVTLKNVGSIATPAQLNVTFTCNDPQLTINTGTAQCGSIAPGATVTVTLNVTVANDIVDGKIFNVTIAVTGGNDTWYSNMPLIAYAPKFNLEKVLLNGTENGNLPIGTLVALTAIVKNEGGASAYNVKGVLEINSEYITFACEELNYAGQNLPAGESMNIDFYVITDMNMPYGYETNLELLLTANYGRSYNAEFKVSNSGTDAYCSSGNQDCSDGDQFSSVILYKTSEPSVLLINNTNTDCSSGGYEDFTNIVFPIEPGENYTIKVKKGAGNYTNHIRGWFDLNGNNSFDSNEQLITNISVANPSTEGSQSFTIPETAEPGSHRFRLVIKFSTAPTSACNNSSYGQTHDYTFTIPELYPRVQNVEAVLTGTTITTTWEAPADGNPEGYNIYRNGNKLNSTILTNLTYTEENVTEGVYVYNVTAVYEGNKESFAEMSNVICNFHAPELCEPPVNLSYTIANNAVTLTWDEPENIDGELTGYNVYRDEEKIGETEAEVREFQDTDIEDGTYLYQVSASYLHCEESELSAGVEVLFVGIKDYYTSSFNIFPNPTTGEFQITSYGLQVTSIEIFDIYGRNLLPLTSYPIPHTVINVSLLQSGVYFVKIYTETGDVAVKRLVIMK